MKWTWMTTCNDQQPPIKHLTIIILYLIMYYPDDAFS